MELGHKFSARRAFVGLYVLAFAVYLIIGLQPAEAVNSVASAELLIPQIGLTTDVVELELKENGLETPAKIAGSYTQAENKTLLIGHSTTVFENLYQVNLGDTINYDNQVYKIIAIDKVPKVDIEMDKILAGADRDTIILMTCAGELLDGGDATHRLIITALSE